MFFLSARGESLGEEIWRDLASPVTTPARTALIAGSTATLLAYGFKYEWGDPLQDDWSVRRPLGDSSKYGDALGQLVPNLAYSIGMAIDGWGFDHSVSKKRTVLML